MTFKIVRSVMLYQLKFLVIFLLTAFFILAVSVMSSFSAKNETETLNSIVAAFQQSRHGHMKTYCQQKTNVHIVHNCRELLRRDLSYN